MKTILSKTQKKVLAKHDRKHLFCVYVVINS